MINIEINYSYIDDIVDRLADNVTVVYHKPNTFEEDKRYNCVSKHEAVDLLLSHVKASENYLVNNVSSDCIRCFQHYAYVYFPIARPRSKVDTIILTFAEETVSWFNKFTDKYKRYLWDRITVYNADYRED